MTTDVLNEAAIAALSSLVDMAAADPITRAEMLGAYERTLATRIAAVDERNRRQTITLPIGYTLTLTYEWQPIGMCRHVSIAPASTNSIPVEKAIALVRRHLDFTPCNSWVEDMADGNKAWNAIQIIDEAPTPP